MPLKSRLLYLSNNVCVTLVRFSVDAYNPHALFICRRLFSLFCRPKFPHHEKHAPASFTEEHDLVLGGALLFSLIKSTFQIVFTCLWDDVMCSTESQTPRAAGKWLKIFHERRGKVELATVSGWETAPKTWEFTQWPTQLRSELNCFN